MSEHYSTSWATAPKWPEESPQKKSKTKSRVAIGIGGAALFFVGIAIGSAGGSSPSSAAQPHPTTTVTQTVNGKAKPGPTVTVTAKAKPAAVNASVSDGVYLVGTDIKAGTYKTAGPASNDVLDSCYWERAKDDSGDWQSILANDNLTGPGRVTVKRGEVVHFDGGCEWVKQ
jgi:hypothetical protein